MKKARFGFKMRLFPVEVCMNYFRPEMDVHDINRISMLGLAHIGDSVYELLVRTMLCATGHQAVNDLHKLTVSYVNAPAQARAAEKILAELTDDEQAVYKRGRNCKVNSVPHNATLGQYHAATGLEALFGWLYLKGETERIDALFARIMEE